MQMNNIISCQEQAVQSFQAGNYIQATNLYEQAITAAPEIVSNYWYLGLSLLLQGQETEAQMTWMLPLAEAEDSTIEIYTQELLQILESEAQRQENLGELSLAWTICQHIREINPQDINNNLKILLLSIKIGNCEETELQELGIIELLKQHPQTNLNLELLLQVLQQVFDTPNLHPSSPDLLEACLNYIEHPQKIFFIVLSAAVKIGHTFKNPQVAAQILELYLRLDVNNVEILRHLAIFYQDGKNHEQGIEKAKLCLALSTELADKIFAAHLLLRGLMSAGGYWEEICATSRELEYFQAEFIKAQPLAIDEVRTLRLLTPSFAIPHIKDSPVEFRNIHNQIAQIFQNNIQTLAVENAKRYSQHCINKQKRTLTARKLKIGYVSYALRRHSVGWLARWLFDHHNRDEFEIYAYLVNYRLVDDFLQELYTHKADKAHKLDMDALEIAETIYADDIDILVDLDSITLDITSEVMALKPAPIQVTWLGWDASGIPAVDYFIADPYVLPDSAQNYYPEKIWRLPHTYVAVDGFEVGVPTLRRQDLDIPDDAVIYLSAQRGYKRHPETTRWQMKIIKEVPNSYFLIKGSAQEDSIQEFFRKIAAEEGVDFSRLKFLSADPTESIHRANLAIADVVLDTYPYNGATTTLETLWMGIPIVTRVGEQFAARNSYTMMMNAGITEGIAWSGEEYVEWGVRLGKDENLRQQISWQLRQSRQTAPLWNGKQFTREIENAYKQMWGQFQVNQ
jgi:predicted O-linked N-acetylglucosamine transferase (SPINDLY family)